MTRTLATIVKMIAILILIFSLPVFGQNKTSEPAAKSKTATPERQYVYYRSWEDGEIKYCHTYPAQQHLLVCDDERDWKQSLQNLAGDNAVAGMAFEDAQNSALAYARAHSREFLLGFLGEPWPKSQSESRLMAWYCTKDKTIKCEPFKKKK